MSKYLKRFLTWESIFLLIILAVAAYVRLWRVSEYMTFLGDEGRDMLVVKRMIVDHKFTLLGPTASVGGFFLGPIYYYFMLPFLWIWRLDPTGPSVMVGLFGVATVYLVYRVGRDFISNWVGLVAASLYALSPLVIAYSRSSWNPNVVPFFSTLLVYLLLRVTTSWKPREIIFSGIALGIGLQLHYLFTFLGVMTILWFFIAIPRTKLARTLGYVIGGFLLGYAPFLLFELRHGFPNTQTLFRFLLEGKETGFEFAQFVKNINEVTFRLFARLLYRFPQPEWWDRFGLWQKNLWMIGTRVTILMSLVLPLWLIFQHKTEKHTKYALKLLLLWYGVVILLFGFYKRGIYDYYFGIVFALPFLLLSLVLWYVFRSNKIGALAIYVLVGVLIAFNWQGRPYRFPPNNQLGQAKMIATEAIEKTQGNPFNFALITGNNSDHAYRYFFEIWGNAPVTIENEILDPERQTVTDQLIVICELPKNECKPLGHPLWEIAGFGRAEIVGEWDVSFVKIFRLVRYTDQ